MTPAARVQAAIEVLDAWLGGAPLERALTGWARAHRFAGSGDRAAIRDHVYQAVRRRDSAAWMGGALSGRGLMLGLLRQEGRDLAEIFTGARHAPAAIGAAEAGRPLEEAPEPVQLDCPEWLYPTFAAMGQEGPAILAALRDRAPVFLRANLLKTTREAALEALAAEGIAAGSDPQSPTAIRLAGPERGLRNSQAFRAGLVELQDAASQAVVDALPLAPGARVLDYCAGGGGKTLAMAARLSGPVDAHDGNPGRMADLPERARRAGAQVALVDSADLKPAAYDLVLADVPCSGSGSWRRDPEGKWRLTPAALADLTALQRRILGRAAGHVAPGGVLAYVTCSVLPQENGGVVDAFLQERPDWRLAESRRFTPLDGGDGFGLALLTR